MQLKSKLQALMPQIIDLLGDLSTEILYHVTGDYQYNPVTGTKTETGSQELTFNCIITSYTDTEINASRGSTVEIFSTDKKILFPSLSLPNITPKLTDWIVINSKKYKIVSQDIDPAEAMWVLCVRV